MLQQDKASSTYELTYGRQNQQGLPIVEQVKITSGSSVTTAYIENDPVTGQPLMLRSSQGIQALYVYGGTGDPVALLTDYATVSYAYQFDPYGVAVLSANGGGNGPVQNPFMFTGGIQDRATGWVHFGARWYNPTTGRWTQQDTLDAPLDPNNANRYAYAGCDPINNMDPTGRALSAQAVCAGAFIVTTILIDGALAVLGIPSAGLAWGIGVAVTVGMFAWEQTVCGDK